MNLQRLLIEKMEHRILVGTVAFLATIAIIGWIAINEPGRMAAFERQFSGRSIERGAALFANNCSTCHGVDGLGVVGRAPALNSPYLFGHDFFAEINREQQALEAELGAEGTTEARVTEIQARLTELQTQRATLTQQLQAAVDAPGDYDPAAPDRLVNLGWGGGLYNFVFTTLVHGRPTSSSYWPQPMAAWAQTAGGPLRNDQLQDLTNYILNWDKGDDWTTEDALAVRQHPIRPVDASTVVASDIETVGRDVPAIVAELANYTGDVQNGMALYNGALACAGCHMNAAVAPLTEGTWTRAETERLADPAVQALGITDPLSYVVHSIVLPNEYISPGYPAGVMPQNFGDRLTYQDMADLVAYLQSQDQQ
ncbi:MAG: c-type cytochrome [bacterium]|nr:c-type cytochrome [bacterium]